MDTGMWQARLDESARRWEVPGASLAVLHDGAVTALATGVLNLDTGVEVTTDSLFQTGSITKVYTATVLLRLLATGGQGVDTPVVELLPGFRVADPQVTRQVTVRHLLSHTSGIDGDLFLDTGRGDDCVQRYVAACADLGQNHPLGATMSYCNAGFVILGRIIERLSGTVWDAALRQHLVEPLGLTRTVTLPEDVLRYRAAIGHLTEPGEKPAVAPVWGLMRAAGPAGLVNATATEVLAFARLHLSGGGDILPAATVAQMQRPQVRVPDRWTLGSHWGLGWVLAEWDGTRVYGHDGNTIGQSAFLRVVPDRGLAIALLTNGGHPRSLFQDLVTELVRELAGLAVPEPPEPADRAGLADPDPVEHAGVYERVGARLTIRPSGRHGLTAYAESTGALAHLMSPREYELRPYMVDGADQVYLGRPPGEPLWSALVFYRLDGGQRYVHFGARATPKRTG